MNTSKTVVVTGAAGYIGGQTMLTLKDAGHRVIGIDRGPVPQHLEGVADRCIQAGFASEPGLAVLATERPTTVVHCAGTSLVSPSAQNPATYYQNNFVDTKCLLDFMRQHAMLPECRVIFASSAAVYGEPVLTPCAESDPPLPVSPYGESKLMTELMLAAYHKAYGLDYVAFRYFNACGADSAGRHGQAPGATHIMARVLESIRDDREFTLNGADYDTPDGTCVRDYVHVEDIALAHHMAMYAVVPAGIYNLGTAVGASNRDIISIAETITGRSLRCTQGTRREGDPAVLTASSERFNLITGWIPRHNIQEIMQHAWTWTQRPCT